MGELLDIFILLPWAVAFAFMWHMDKNF